MESESTAVENQNENENPQSTIESLAELLTSEDNGEAKKIETRQVSDEPPKRFNDLAEKLGVSLEDLYKLEVSQAEDGTPVTIESLKDAYSKAEDLAFREIEFEENRTKTEAELLRAQQEIRDLLSSLPEKAVKPEVLEKLRERHEAQAKLERKRMLEVIPEWSDEKVRTADIEGMSEHLRQYGYPVDHLERVADHRQIKYIRDNWQREMRIRKALEAVKAGKPNPTKPSRPSGKPPSKGPLAGVKRGNARNKLEAVFSQLE